MELPFSPVLLGGVALLPPYLSRFLPHHSPVPHVFLTQGHCPAGHPLLVLSSSFLPVLSHFLQGTFLDDSNSHGLTGQFRMSEKNVRDHLGQPLGPQMRKLRLEMTETGPRSSNEMGIAGTRAVSSVRPCAWPQLLASLHLFVCLHALSTGFGLPEPLSPLANSAEPKFFLSWHSLLSGSPLAMTFLPSGP